MPVRTAYIRRFDGGIFNDPRVPNSALSRVVTNFDILTNPYKMTPYRDSESGDNNAASSQRQNFQIALRTGTTYSVYALGVVDGTARAEIEYKNLSTGGSNDLSDNTWTATGNNASSSGATNFNLFINYKKTGRTYGARAGTAIWAYDPTGSAAWTDTERSISYTNIAQGCVHPADDILYVPYDNKIAKNDNGTWTDVALTLPSHFYITSICPYRTHLAIFCAPLSGEGSSVVFLWNRDTSLATVDEAIDWGEGVVKVGEEVNGDLLGISLSGNSSTRFFARIIIRRFAGYGSEKIIELIGGSSTALLPIAKQKINNRLHFMMQISVNGSVREGVFSIGRSPGEPYSLIHERTPNNDTALVSSSNLFNFIYVGDFLLQAYLSNSAYAISKTNDQSSFTASSIYESEINPDMPLTHKPQLKQLMSVGALYEKLPTAGSVQVQYRVDGGDWVTVFTETTDGATYTEPKPQNADGSQFKKGKDYECRAVSTGGAEITGIVYKYKVLASNA